MITSPGKKYVTVQAALQQARTILQGLQTAQLDAELLLAYLLETTREALYAHPETLVDDNLVHDLYALLNNRAAGVPIAYLTGTKEFWSLPLSVSRAALVPRPETECLVEAALQWIPADATMHILDLGTGSGAIAIAIASERPACQVVAVDIDAAALELARANAARLGLANIRFALSDWFAGLHGQEFDIIISNPPYIDSNFPGLVESELRYEPRLALDGGYLGLQAYHRIIPAAAGHLRSGAFLLLEHGFDQAQALQQLFTANHYLDCITCKDYAGLDRVTYARRK